MTSSDDMDAAGWDQLCEECGQPLIAHVVYLETMDMPAQAVEGSFLNTDIHGFYCPPETMITVAPLWEDVEASEEFL